MPAKMTYESMEEEILFITGELKFLQKKYRFYDRDTDPNTVPKHAWEKKRELHERKVHLTGLRRTYLMSQRGYKNPITKEMLNRIEQLKLERGVQGPSVGFE